MENTERKIVFRNRGKAHRGLVLSGTNGEYLVASCRCPGSQNGSLTRGAQIICEGWDRATCRDVAGRI